MQNSASLPEGLLSGQPLRVGGISGEREWLTIQRTKIAPGANWQRERDS